MEKHKRLIRVSAGQLPAELAGKSREEKRKRNLKLLLEMIKTAAEQLSDLILFGEYANLEHRSVSTKKSDYIPEPISGPFVDAIAAVAKKHRINVALPVFGRWGNAVSSYVLFIDRIGGIIDIYQKTHPTVAEQRLGIVPGSELKIVELDFGRVGTMTCMDIEYPEVAQVLMLRGAELLLFPHVQAGWGETDWDIRYRSRAVDTGLPVLSACFGYDEGDWTPGKMIGRSGAIGRDGGILCDLGRRVGIVTCDLDLNTGRMTEFFFPRKLNRTLAVKASRRPELYADLTDERMKQKAVREIQRSEVRGRKSAPPQTKNQ